MKHIFVAINFPQEIKQKLARLQKELAQSLPNVRWILSKNIHLTLTFLGPLGKLETIKATEVVKEELINVEVFSLYLRGFGIFPNKLRPKTIWIGVYPDLTLRLLNQAMFRKLTNKGFVLDERTFMPHVTIGRIKEKSNKDVVKFLLNKYQSTEFGDVEIKDVQVMESTLLRSGSVYKTIKSIRLNRRDNVS